MGVTMWQKLKSIRWHHWAIVILAILLGISVSRQFFGSSEYQFINAGNGRLYRVNKISGETQLIYGRQIYDLLSAA